MGRLRGMDSQLALSQDTVPSPRTKTMTSPSDEEPGVAAQARDAWTAAWAAGREAFMGTAKQKGPLPNGATHQDDNTNGRKTQLCSGWDLSRAPRGRRGTRPEGAAPGTARLLAWKEETRTNMNSKVTEMEKFTEKKTSERWDETL